MGGLRNGFEELPMSIMSTVSHLMAEPHCAVALMEGVGYGVAAVVARFWHAWVWVCYVGLMGLQVLVALVLGGVVALG